MLSPSALSSPPEHFNFATDVVDAWASKNPDLMAMHWIDNGGSQSSKLSYGYFSKQSHKAAQLLTDLGGRRGDRVMIVLNRVPAW
jgi:medium-chain acyl-CoA synthetase